jgi:murein DD-endopeptidase MepM/ murein hydrolase activator NlpD
VAHPKRGILSRKTSVTGAPRPLLRIGVALALTLAIGVGAFGIAPDTTLVTVPTTLVREELVVEPDRSADDGSPLSFWREERIQRGDTIGAVLARLGIEDPEAMHFVRTEPRARAIYQLKPGRAVRAEVDEDGLLQRLRYLTSPAEELYIERSPAGLAAHIGPARAEARMHTRSASIQSSLFGAADDAGIPDAVTLKLAEIFSAEIDFLRDLRRGDHFTVVYEMVYVDGEPVRSGRLIAAQFHNRGAAYKAYWWTDSEGRGGYYDDDGKSLRAAFLRSPMEFSRITSGFSLARRHPIHDVWRAHKGVDYGAPIGTPVRSTADGKVNFAGRQGGYGNVVIVQHQGAHSTLYAHLSRFASGLRVGTRIDQGQVIGYVGQTGWATGPHLHYEFRVKNQQQDPLRIALPQAVSVPAGELRAFRSAVTPLSARMELLSNFPVALVN